MRKKIEKIELLLTIVAIVAIILGGFYLAVLIWFGLPRPDQVDVAQALLALSFVIGILAVTGVVCLRQRRHKFALEDLAFCSCVTLVQGAALGLIVMLLMACGAEIPEPMGVALKHPTLGVMALGFIGMSVFFLIHCIGAISCRNYWGALQAGCLALLMATIIVLGSQFYILSLPLSVSDAGCWVALACIVGGCVVIFMRRQQYDG